MQVSRPQNDVSARQPHPMPIVYGAQRYRGDPLLQGAHVQPRLKVAAQPEQDSR